MRFAIKKMSVRRQDRLDELQSPMNEKLRALREELAPLAVAYREAAKAKAAGGPVGALVMGDAKIRRAKDERGDQ